MKKSDFITFINSSRNINEVTVTIRWSRSNAFKFWGKIISDFGFYTQPNYQLSLEETNVFSEMQSLQNLHVTSEVLLEDMLH